MVLSNDKNLRTELTSETSLRMSNKAFDVAVCIATMNRPVGLAEALQSIAKITFDKCPQPTIKVCVVDNDPSGSSAEVIQQESLNFPFLLEYQIEPIMGIPFARNRLVAMAADAEFLAFIDDDEYVSAQWLDELLAIQRQTEADAVLGPVVPVMPADSPAWMHKYFTHGSPSEQIKPRVTWHTFRTSNILLRVESLRSLQGPFDVFFSDFGGSDSELGFRMDSRGDRLMWCDDAIAYESVPIQRANLSWLWLRRFRYGCSNAIIDNRHSSAWFRCKRCLKHVASMGFGAVTFVPSLVRGMPAAVPNLMRIAFGLGYLFGATGGRYREYKNPGVKN